MTATIEEILTNQREHWGNVVYELLQGKKTTHWCWYFLPNVPGLGKSPNAQHFALDPATFIDYFIGNAEYRGNLITTTMLIDQAYRNSNSVNLQDILGEVDVLKFRSFLTLAKSTLSAYSFNHSSKDYLPIPYWKILLHAHECYGTCEYTSETCRDVYVDLLRVRGKLKEAINT